MEFDRRMAMTAGLGAAGLATAVALPALARTRQFDLASPADRLRIYMAVRGALDDRLVIGWMHARYYGVVDDRMDPLFAVVSAVFARYRALPDGGYEAVSAELAWFIDPVTGLALDTYSNPYTGQQNTVPTGGMPPSKFRFGPDLSFHLARDVPGLEMQHEVLPFDMRGDDVWITERSRSAFTFPGAAKPFRYSESNTFHTRRSALLVPGVKQVTSDVSFTNVCSWRPWMKMGDRPGHLTATGMGLQGATMASIPPEWIAATQARRPEVLKDPAALLAPLWNAR